MWFLYIVRCADGSIYCGISTDVSRRVEEHNRNPERASRYCWSRRPVELMGYALCDSKRHALRAERAFKRLPRWRKKLLCGDEALANFVGAS